MSVGPDPVAARRARIARAVVIAKRVGYGALLVAVVAFFVGLAADLPAWSVACTIGGLVVAIVVLPLPIVLGYGIRAAEREERQQRHPREQQARPDPRGSSPREGGP